MQRIMVMGPPGSGKSSFARELGAKLDLPVFHLDQAYHLPGWVAVPQDIFRAEVERIAALPSWIIDGNYLDTIVVRVNAADTIIYLDVSRWLSVQRLAKRIITLRGRVRSDAAPGCPERWNVEFLHYAWNWNRIHGAGVLARVHGFEGRKIILNGQSQQKQFWQKHL